MKPAARYGDDARGDQPALRETGCRAAAVARVGQRRCGIGTMGREKKVDEASHLCQLDRKKGW